MRQWINLFEQFKWSDKTIGDDVLVWVDVEKINQSWAKDKDFYFDSPDHPNAIGSRVDRFGQWITRGEPIRAPEISLVNGEVFFTNGRHRFFWMMANGVEKIPVAVPPAQAGKIQAKFG